LADDKTASHNQSARRLCENERNVLDVFEYQVADDQVERAVLNRPGPRQVGRPKTDIVVANLAFGLLEHPGRKIEPHHQIAELAQQPGILPRTTTDLQD